MVSKILYHYIQLWIKLCISKWIREGCSIVYYFPSINGKVKKYHHVIIIQKRFLNRSVKFSIIQMSKEAVNHMQLMLWCCDGTIKYCDSRKYTFWTLDRFSSEKFIRLWINLSVTTFFFLQTIFIVSLKFRLPSLGQI